MAYGVKSVLGNDFCHAMFLVLFCAKNSDNVISEGQLDREGYSFTRSARRCKIQHKENNEIVGFANQDESFIYHVKKFHLFHNEYSKCSRKEYVGTSLNFEAS